MKTAITFLAIIISFGLNAQKVNWMSWDEAVEANKQNPKLIFVDVYTDWCGWCKKMDASTFGNPVIAKYMSENYYAVKFNAEGKDTINFADVAWLLTSSSFVLLMTPGLSFFLWRNGRKKECNFYHVAKFYFTRSG